MNALPFCVRCGHAFEQHRGWRDCVGARDCACPGYSSAMPLRIEPGARVRVLLRPESPPPHEQADGTVIAVAGGYATVRLDDGTERVVEQRHLR